LVFRPVAFSVSAMSLSSITIFVRTVHIFHLLRTHHTLDSASMHRAPTPNPSLKLTRYGRRCKPGPRQLYYCREPGLQHLPPRAA
jgi:hypothetical protein